MDESEFVVVDEEHKESVEFDNLAEVVQAYGAARESLLKGVTLLHDTLNLNMELALKNTPPDFESNSDDLMRRILGSARFLFLCSKLVAVKKEYEDLANKFESLNTQGSPESSAKLVHLAGVFDQIDALLPPSCDASTVGPSKTAPTADVEELCTRAEIIRDRVKLVMEARLGSTSDLGQPEQRDRPDLESNTSSSPKAESNMDISRMIREEVTSVFQSEMGNIMERQRDLIQQVLKPLTEGKRKEDHAQFPADGFLDSTEGDKSHSASFSPKPSTTSPSYLGPYANEDVVVIEVREKSTQPPLQNPGDASSSVTQPMSSSQSQPGPSRRQKPSFLPDDETPVCPKCQIWLPDRDALEIHLDTCLQ
ncbi:hypothetical protein EGR_01865 [Echinococcus granulosus]|uniref:Uncharacterized protein n=1 Tax=Echinococcus granulosus TaxID=6210 RepID=W6V9N8_ECHGR|nr:hypothetical protein EGR_01865 [Echinococcus granulosus]EUB63374.1 hypothetical protein EGR_01865 [Echinococcus granulosus]